MDGSQIEHGDSLKRLSASTKGQGKTAVGQTEWQVVERPAVEPTDGVYPPLVDSWLTVGASAAPAASTRIELLADGGKRCVASAIVTAAEESRIPALCRLEAAALKGAILISDVRIEPSKADALWAPLLYLALRRGRIWGRAVAMAAVAGADQAEVRLVDLGALAKVAPVSHDGKRYHAVAQRIDLAIHRAFFAASPELRAVLRERFVPEAVETLDRWITGFFQCSWFRALHDGTLAREQYIYTLSNLHQFVRWTTRLVGRAVFHSMDKGLRAKWLAHLQDEMNHELILEKDLQFLGADVEYVKEPMVPSVSTQEFMVIQEAIIAFHQDPVLFMATPFVAEGYASRLDGKFVQALEASATRWGVKNPKSVTTFYASHINYDGGEDGHWALTRDILKEHLVDDSQLTRFLNIMKMATDTTERSYAGYHDDLSLFGAISRA